MAAVFWLLSMGVTVLVVIGFALLTRRALRRGPGGGHETWLR